MTPRGKGTDNKLDLGKHQVHRVVAGQDTYALALGPFVVKLEDDPARIAGMKRLIDAACGDQLGWTPRSMFRESHGDRHIWFAVLRDDDVVGGGRFTGRHEPHGFHIHRARPFDLPLSQALEALERGSISFEGVPVALRADVRHRLLWMLLYLRMSFFLQACNGLGLGVATQRLGSITPLMS